MKNEKALAVVEVLFAVIVWGASFIATKVALKYLDPIPLVWSRFAIGVVILGAATLVRRQFALPGKRDLAYLALLGFLGVTLHQWLQSTGLQTSQATTTGWIIATIPVFMALLGWVFLKEKITPVVWLGILLSAVGVVLIVSRGNLQAFFAGGIGAPGDVLVLLSAPNWAVFSILSRRGLRQHPATRMMFYVMGFGWLFSSALLLLNPAGLNLGSMPLDGWLAVLFLGVAVSGLAYLAWYDALKLIPAAQIGVFLYIEPLVTMLLAALMLDEPLVWSSVVGGAIVLAGVWLVNRK